MRAHRPERAIFVQTFGLYKHARVRATAGPDLPSIGFMLTIHSGIVAVVPHPSLQLARSSRDGSNCDHQPALRSLLLGP